MSFFYLIHWIWVRAWDLMQRQVSSLAIEGGKSHPPEFEIGARAWGSSHDARLSIFPLIRAQFGKVRRRCARANSKRKKQE